MILVPVIRAAQAAYDVCLDLTGIRVRTYRIVIFFGSEGIAALSACCAHQAHLGVRMGFATLIAWLIMFGPRARCRIDNKDQAAGRLDAVNRRALLAAEYILGIVAFLLILGLPASWFFEIYERPFYFAELFAFILFPINECILVRERDAARFSWRQPMPAGEAA